MCPSIRACIHRAGPVGLPPRWFCCLNFVHNPDPQVNASRAGVGIAALIYALLLSLVVIADAKRHDEGNHCMARQEWAAKLRVQLAELEQKLHAPGTTGMHQRVVYTRRPQPLSVGQLPVTV